ncbi:MAG: methionine aminopeptidase [Nitrospira bacterium SM23_35]|jgi:methionyl aminopeptidase|nr:MAG: methionine aminopeptidase [Nitrospira bacterium SM23_35]
MIILKSAEEIEKIAQSCLIVAKALDSLRNMVIPGVATKTLEQFADTYIRSNNAVPAFKGYRGYPASICTSVNNEVIHGIPSDRVLEEGDIIGIDLGVYKDGFYGDAACTFGVGQITPEAEKLLRVTEESLYLGIENAKKAHRVSDISCAIQEHIESNGFSVVKAFVGHGIGRSLHEDPQVPNFGQRGLGPRLSPGMTIAIEPMVNTGGYEVVVLEDGWTAVTLDGTLSAHFEHTILVTEDQPRILTKIDEKE